MRSIFFLTAVFIGLFTSGQELILPSNNEIILKEGTVDTTYFIGLKLINRPRSGDLELTISNSPEGTAVEGVDYSYMSGVLGKHTFKHISNEDDFAIGIVIKSRKIRREKIDFIIQFSYLQKGITVNKKLKVIIDPINPIEKKVLYPDTSKWSLRIITGSNFDFFDAPTFKNFAGDLQAFLPDLIQIGRKTKNKKDRSIGINAGFFNFRYFEADSIFRTINIY